MLTVIAFIGVFYAARGYAHHPVASIYRTDQKETITGQLVEFQLRNPHSIVLLDRLGPAPGQSQRWSVEWLAAFQLGRQGITSTTLRAGDRLLITVMMRTIVRPSDGWHWRGTFE